MSDFVSVLLSRLVGRLPLVCKPSAHFSVVIKVSYFGSRLPLGADGQSPVGFYFYFCQLLCSTPVKGQIIFNYCHLRN